jgi:hypothetical protein
MVKFTAASAAVSAAFDLNILRPPSNFIRVPELYLLLDTMDGLGTRAFLWLAL